MPKEPLMEFNLEAKSFVCDCGASLFGYVTTYYPVNVLVSGPEGKRFCVVSPLEHSTKLEKFICINCHKEFAESEILNSPRI
jgi:hypothetical protein